MCFILILYAVFFLQQQQWFVFYHIWTTKQRRKVFEISYYFEWFLIFAISDYPFLLFMLISFVFSDSIGDSLAMVDSYPLFIAIFELIIVNCGILLPKNKKHQSTRSSITLTGEDENGRRWGDWQHRYFLCLFLLIIGIVLLDKPGFIFGYSGYDVNVRDQLLSSVFAILAAISLAINIIANTLMEKLTDEDYLAEVKSIKMAERLEQQQQLEQQRRQQQQQKRLAIKGPNQLQLENNRKNVATSSSVSSSSGESTVVEVDTGLELAESVSDSSGESSGGSGRGISPSNTSEEGVDMAIGDHTNEDGVNETTSLLSNNSLDDDLRLSYVNGGGAGGAGTGAGNGTAAAGNSSSFHHSAPGKVLVGLQVYKNYESVLNRGQGKISNVRAKSEDCMPSGPFDVDTELEKNNEIKKTKNKKSDKNEYIILNEKEMTIFAIEYSSVIQVLLCFIFSGLSWIDDGHGIFKQFLLFRATNDESFTNDAIHYVVLSSFLWSLHIFCCTLGIFKLSNAVLSGILDISDVFFAFFFSYIFFNEKRDACDIGGAIAIVSTVIISVYPWQTFRWIPNRF